MLKIEIVGVIALSLFGLTFLAAIGMVLAGLTGVFAERYGQHPVARKVGGHWQLLAQRLGIGAAVCLIASLLFFEWEQGLRRGRLQEIASHHVQSITIRSADGLVVLEGQVASSFAKLLVSGRNVPAHHSSPLRMISVEIRGAMDHKYSLGEDGDATGEYWLWEEGWWRGQVNVRQFQSSELAEFLEEHSIDLH